MNWMVVGCGAILLICVIWGWLRGFVKMVFHFLAVALALVLAASLCQPLAKVMMQQESVVSSVKKHVRESLGLDKLAEKGTITEDDINKLKLPEVVKQQLKDHNTEEGYKLFDADNAADYVAELVTNVIVRAACFVILFLTSLAIIYLLGVALNFTAKLPILSTMNRVSGAMVGLFVGAVLILMFFTVITALGNTEFGRNCQAAIAESNLLSSIYNNNIICDVYLDLTDKL
ncbi:MAG: CvpA family protein [Lachnospiraceae bacterium]|nr:CvpA family protein [Lachnospiraceae bacterium]